MAPFRFVFDAEPGGGVVDALDDARRRRRLRRPGSRPARRGRSAVPPSVGRRRAAGGRGVPSPAAGAAPVRGRAAPPAPRRSTAPVGAAAVGAAGAAATAAGAAAIAAAAASGAPPGGGGDPDGGVGAGAFAAAGKAVEGDVGRERGEGDDRGGDQRRGRGAAGQERAQVDLLGAARCGAARGVWAIEVISKSRYPSRPRCLPRDKDRQSRDCGSLDHRRHRPKPLAPHSRRGATGIRADRRRRR